MPGKKKSEKIQSDLDKKEEVVSNEGALAPQLSEPTEEKTPIAEEKSEMSLAETPEEEKKSTEADSQEVKAAQMREELSATTEKKHRFVLNKQMKIGVLLLIIALLASIPAIYLYSQYKASQQKQNPTAAAQAQVQSLITRVGQLILLPTNEVPTVATVSDKTKLAGQTFFAHAENGDQVLIYQASRKAYLYRPSTNKIIEVGPVNIEPTKSAAVEPETAVAGASISATLSPTPTEISVALYNGTNTSGLTRKAEPLVAKAGSGIKVIAKENAASTDYTDTQVVVLKESVSSVAKEMANAVHGSIVTSLPEGEAVPTADILVILGSDFAE